MIKGKKNKKNKKKIISEQYLLCSRLLISDNYSSVEASGVGLIIQ